MDSRAEQTQARIGHILFAEFAHSETLHSQADGAELARLRKSLCEHPTVIAGIESREAVVIHYPSAVAAVFLDNLAAAVRLGEHLAQTEEGAKSRIGIHSGPVTLSEDSAVPTSGYGLIIAERVAASARSGKVHLSSTVRDLLIQMGGMGRKFSDGGNLPLDNVTSIQLYCIEDQSYPASNSLDGPKANSPGGKSDSDKIVALWNSSPVFRSLVLCGIGGLASQLFVSSKQVTGDFEIFWFPGIIFGLIWSINTFRTISKITSFASLSACVYFLASRFTFENTDILAPGAGYAIFAAAFFGAFSLAVITHLFCAVKFNWISIALIGFVGLACIFVVYISPSPALLYSAWQALVGASLTHLIASKSSYAQHEDFAERLTAFLQGPIVQLIGLVGTIAGFISMAN